MNVKLVVFISSLPVVILVSLVLKIEIIRQYYFLFVLTWIEQLHANISLIITHFRIMNAVYFKVNFSLADGNTAKLFI